MQNMNPLSTKTKTLYGFLVRQRERGTHSFFVFAANASEVLQWSQVDRLEDRKGGIQRRLSEAKVLAVQRFFELNKDNTIPTSTVLAFRPGCTRFSKTNRSFPHGKSIEWGKLTFSFDPRAPESQRPAFVVDGQHRLNGMAAFKDEALPVLVAALIDADPNEQAFQFVVINNKASKVPPDLVRSLIVDFDEQGLDARLASARISLRGRANLISIVDDDPASPFRAMVDWERRRGKGKPCIKPAAIDGSLAYARHRLIALVDDDDNTIEFFFRAWEGVRKAYPTLWRQTDNNLFSNAGFRAFNEFLVEEIDALIGMGYADLNDQKQIADTAYTLATQVDVHFWTVSWHWKSLDTSAGRDIIKADIRRIRQNKREKLEWSDEVRVLASGAAE
jgi:DGQHR domain-containing protein